MTLKLFCTIQIRLGVSGTRIRTTHHTYSPRSALLGSQTYSSGCWAGCRTSRCACSPAGPLWRQQPVCVPLLSAPRLRFQIEFPLWKKPNTRRFPHASWDDYWCCKDRRWETKRWRERRGKGNDQAEDVEEGTRGTAVIVSGRERDPDGSACREERGRKKVGGKKLGYKFLPVNTRAHVCTLTHTSLSPTHTHTGRDTTLCVIQDTVTCAQLGGNELHCGTNHGNIKTALP